MKDMIPVCLAIVVIGGLECFALHKGIDGIVFSGALVIIAGLAGFKVKDVVTRANRIVKKRKGD